MVNENENDGSRDYDERDSGMVVLIIGMMFVLVTGFIHGFYTRIYNINVTMPHSSSNRHNKTHALESLSNSHIELNVHKPVTQNESITTNNELNTQSELVIS